jgi:hypothetical protein
MLPNQSSIEVELFEFTAGAGTDMPLAPVWLRFSVPEMAISLAHEYDSSSLVFCKHDSHCRKHRLFRRGTRDTETWILDTCLLGS